MAGWRNPEQIELVYTAMQSPWTQPRCQLRNISADGRTLTMAPCLHALPGGRVHGSLRWFMSGLPATIENAFELLKHPGEFYVDTAAAEVLYIPREGEDIATAEAVVPAVETLIHSVGASDLTFEGISFEHTGWDGPSRPCGYVPIQAGQAQCIDDRKPTPAAERAATSAAAPSFVLGAGGRPSLAASSSLVSESGAVTLTLRTDGNLCVQGPGFDVDWCAGQPHKNDSTYDSLYNSSFRCASVSPCCLPLQIIGVQLQPDLCKGRDRSMCNPRYRGRVQTDGNVCVGNSRQDVWCLLSSAFSTGKYYLLLANDGSVNRTAIAGIWSAFAPSSRALLVWGRCASTAGPFRQAKARSGAAPT